MFRNYQLQNVADMLKRLIENADRRSNAARRGKQAALQALQEFERSSWNPDAFETAVLDTGGHFALDGKRLTYAGDDVLTDAQAVLTRYYEVFPTARPKPERIDADAAATMTIAQAAKYLGVSRDTMKKYVYRDKVIHGTEINPRLRLFSADELDAYRPHMPKIGPPFKKTPENEGSR